MNSPQTSKDASLFLKSLQEEGVEEIYVRAGGSPKAAARTHPIIKSGVASSEFAALNPAVESERVTSEGMSPARSEMLKLREQALACTRCQELYGTRTKVVFGAGNIKARLMFVGEAPGYDEDQQGLPFVGAAGQLLTKIIEAMGLTRSQVFIANTLKCRPPGNRQPKPEEIENCSPFLQKQIELIRPEIICALGTFAAQTLLKKADSISRMRGKFYDLGNGIRVIPTFHPAYLLRNPEEKRKVWDDMKAIKAELEKNPRP